MISTWGQLQGTLSVPALKDEAVPLLSSDDVPPSTPRSYKGRLLTEGLNDLPDCTDHPSGKKESWVAQHLETARCIQFCSVDSLLPTGGKVGGGHQPRTQEEVWLPQNQKMAKVQVWGWLAGVRMPSGFSIPGWKARIFTPGACNWFSICKAKQICINRENPQERLFRF